MSEANEVQRAVMWCTLPIKVPMFIIGLIILPFYVAIDYGTSPCREKQYTVFLIRNFKGLVRFLTT
jgi:hypothetical protein